MPNPHNANEKCSGCRFFKSHSHKPGGYAMSGDGSCLRFPPTQGQQNGRTVLNTVAKGDWCGEYQPIPEQKSALPK